MLFAVERILFSLKALFNFSLSALKKLDNYKMAMGIAHMNPQVSNYC